MTKLNLRSRTAAGAFGAALFLAAACSGALSQPPGQTGSPAAPATNEGQLVIPHQQERPLPDRPIGEFGAVTDGGLPGEVLRVTTLAARGPGSLRAAIEARHPRLVIFDVGGVIDLEGRTLVVRSPYLTVAGQTAPDPGITIIRGGVVVETHDVVIQHLAVRPGDRGHGNPDRDWAPDALSVRRGNSGPAHDIVFEHCSATWAVDENLSTSGPADADPAADADVTARDITIRHCLIAEALSESTHPKGEHSKGTLVHDGVRNVAIIGSVYAHNRERNPRLKGGSTAAILDNVMYNWGSACVAIGSRGNQKMLSPAEAVIAGNVAIAGPDTRAKIFVKGHDEGGRAFFGDNITVDSEGKPMRVKDSRVVDLGTPPSAHAPLDAATRALRSAGSRPARRDPIDTRIIRSVIDGTGQHINSQDQVGGYPVRKATHRAVEVPADIDARRRWLASLSAALAEDRTLDVAPLWRRLGIE